jgi:hypothetical protein
MAILDGLDDVLKIQILARRPEKKFAKLFSVLDNAVHIRVK